MNITDGTYEKDNLGYRSKKVFVEDNRRKRTGWWKDKETYRTLKKQSVVRENYYIVDTYDHEIGRERGDPNNKNKRTNKKFTNRPDKKYLR